jgi:hypothetical protein
MNSTLLRPVRTTVRDADAAIRTRRTFTAANMSARATDADHQYRGGAGILPSSWLSTFYRDTADGLAYIVYSYSTPIGWERSDGLRVIPAVTYSNTTARHQRAVRSAWGMRWGTEYSHLTRPLSDF